MFNNFFNIIKEICSEENISFKAISKDWIIILEKNGLTKYISGYKFDLNNHALGILLDDKYATYDLLKEKNFPVISHSIVYSLNNDNDYAIGNNSIEYLEKIFHKYNDDIVLKINGGTCGVNVLHIKKLGELVEKYKSLTNRYNSLSVCPFYNIQNEYRIIVLNNSVELIYKKERPIVVGNGKSTIIELLKDFNNSYFKNIRNKELNKVLKLEEVFEYDWRFNLATGARASQEIGKEDSEKIKSLAINISKTIGLGFGSIDIVKTTNGNFFIMEINSGVMMDNYIKQIPEGYIIAKKIYKNAIESLFET